MHGKSVPGAEQRAGKEGRPAKHVSVRSVVAWCAHVPHTKKDVPVVVVVKVVPGAMSGLRRAEKRRARNVAEATHAPRVPLSGEPYMARGGRGGGAAAERKKPAAVVPVVD